MAGDSRVDEEIREEYGNAIKADGALTLPLAAIDVF